jgi:hypothetical protein
MKRVLHLAFFLFISFNLFAQAPQKMTYQAVIRNASNNLVVNAPVKMKISILQGSISGTAVYSELHNPTTNANGLVSIEIGSGTSPVGTIGSINWGNGTYFLKTETDPTNGTNYSIEGTSQLLSVPYALNAKCVDLSVSPIGDSVKIGCSSIILPGATKANFEPKINDGLVGYWPFNGNANDESGNNNNGVVNGATLTTDRFGNTGKAYKFNGQNNNIVVQNSTTLNPTSITICAWINAERNDGLIIQKGNPTNATEISYRLVYEDVNTQLGLATGWGVGECNTINNNFIGIGTGVIPKNNWAFVVTTISNNGQVKQYYNNNEIKSSSGSPFKSCNSASSTIRIGGLHWQDDTEWFLGKIDEVRIYNRVLTQEEITYLYNN